MMRLKMSFHSEGGRTMRGLRKAGMVVSLLAIGLVMTAVAGAEDWPVPEYRTEPGAFRKQYVRYHVGPLV